MNENQDERLRSLLRDALPPAGASAPGRDLWPRMLHRMRRPPTRVSWLDFALAGAAAAGFIAFPQLIPWVLWHC